jgi:hypothetical protein
MQIMYAAPFLLTAGIAFIVLSSVPRLRRWAITVPTGVVAFGPGALAAFLVAALIADKVLGYHGAANWTFAVFYVLGGIAAAIVAAFLARHAMPFLGNPLRRAAIAIAAFCSYYVVLLGIRIASASIFPKLEPLGWLIPATIGIISAAAAWLLARQVHEFFPGRAVWSGFRTRRVSAVHRP